jgi:hypothetical protein
VQTAFGIARSDATEENSVMKNETIIENAARKSNTAYPVDEATREFSESLLRSLDDGKAWLLGEKPVTDVYKYYESQLQKAETL